MKDRLLYIIIYTVMMLPLTACAQKLNNDDGMHRYNTHEMTVGKADFVDTIQIEFVGDQIYIPVYIDGKRHLFNLDTGSSQGVAYIGANTGYSSPLGNINSRDANGLTDTIPIVEYPELKLGSPDGLSIRGYKASLLQRHNKHNIYDGIIGFDLFNKGLQAKIDAKRKRLILTDRKNYFDKEPGFEIKYKLKRWTPYLSINTWLDYNEPVLFDMGSTDLFVVNKTHFDAERKKDPRVPKLVEETTYGQNTVGSYGAEKRDLIFFLRFPTLPWGNFTFRNVHSYTTQGDSKFGGAILNYGTFVINPKRKRMKFWSYTGGNSVEVNNHIDDVSYMEDDGQTVVASIRHTSEYYKDGFREGDVVVSVDGRMVSGIDDFNNIKFTKGKTYKFILKDSRGFNKEIEVNYK